MLSSSKSPLVSFILPCYNAENFIVNTIESIIKQSYKNWECIIIEDGSTDNSYQKIKDYPSKHSNLKIIKQENQGLSLSRNKGLEKANGEYVFFIDADDLIAGDCLSNMVESIIKYPDIDIIVGKTAITSGQNSIVKGYLNHNDTSDCFFNENKNVLKEVVIKDIICTCHNKLFKKKFLNDNKIVFFEKLLHEDELFFFETIFYCKSICFNQETTYFYNINNQDSITKNITLKNIDSYIFILQYIYKNYYLKTDNSNSKEIIAFFIIDFKKIIITYLDKLKKEEVDIATKRIKDSFSKILPERNDMIADRSVEKYYLKFYVLSLLSPSIALQFLKNNFKTKMEKWELKFFIFYSSLLNYKTLKKTYKIKH